MARERKKTMNQRKWLTAKVKMNIEIAREREKKPETMADW